MNSEEVEPILVDVFAGIQPRGKTMTPNWVKVTARSDVERLRAELMTMHADIQRLRLRCKRQRTELRRLNKVLGPYWRGVSSGACFERVCTLRSKMIAAFGGKAVFEAEHGKKEEGK